MARPALEYFASIGVSTTVASNLIAEANELIIGLSNARTVLCDCTTQVEELASLAREADVVVSLVPPTLHVAVLKACILAHKNMITASYISPALRELEEQAKAAGVAVMNEVGLDPGIDHMTAAKLIGELKNSGAEIEAFISSCGALPAKSSIDNPLLYKLTWQPSGALKTCLRPAKYLEEGEIVEIPGGELIYRTTQDYSIDFPADIQIWANGDSTGYIDLLGLQGIKTFKRCTFRYRGTVEMLKALIELGVYNEQAVELQPDLPWRELMDRLAGSSSNEFSPPVDFPDTLRDLGAKIAGKLVGKSQSLITEIIEGLWKLDMLSDLPIGPAGSVFAAFVSLMQTKLEFKPTDQDVVLMEHKFIVNRHSHRAEVTSTLITEGGGGSATAVAKLVGLPLACGAEWMLMNQLEPGLHSPMKPEFYIPVLAKLESLGVTFIEVERPLN
jgi:saccharopine dehydrogenase-like NADP-dependent oxidoreductase